MKPRADNWSLADCAIPAKLQRRAGRMLAAGASFEETLAELRRRGAERVSLKTVEEFFRSSPELQRERVERRRQAVEELKQALSDPGSQRRSLAEAALLTGLTELTWPAGLYGGQAERRNYKLQLHTLQLKHHNASLGQRLAETRLQLETARWEVARLKLAELERELEQELRQHHLDLGSMEKIQQIHGLISRSTAHRRRARRSSNGTGYQPRAAESNPSGEE